MIKEEKQSRLITVAIFLLGMWFGGLYVASMKFPREVVMLDIIRSQNLIIERIRLNYERQNNK